MEQQLDATYLRPAVFERAAAIAMVAVAIGIGTLLAAWGISLLWRYTPPDIVVRQEKPFEFAPPPPPAVTNGVGGDAKTATGEVIRREVTVFSKVKHGPGTVVTGWRYKDGRGIVPVGQYCYYDAPNVDHSSTRVDIAFNGDRASHISALLVPDLEGALKKCQWWQA